jgi:hypothetical protein
MFLKSFPKTKTKFVNLDLLYVELKQYYISFLLSIFIKYTKLANGKRSGKKRCSRFVLFEKHEKNRSLKKINEGTIKK